MYTDQCILIRYSLNSKETPYTKLIVLMKELSWGSFIQNVELISPVKPVFKECNDTSISAAGGSSSLS